MNRKILLFIFILIVSACTSPQVTEETDCCLPVDFTAPVPTETPMPTATEKFYPTLSPEEQAEIYAYETMIAQYPNICKNPHPYPKFSPNNLWLEEFCVPRLEDKVALILSNKETQGLWKIFYSDYIPYTDIVPDGELAVAHWSKDGKYAYFNSYSNGSGGECFVLGNDGGWGLFRLDLQTGDITTILPVIDPSVWYMFSFSPTDKRLVYRESKMDFTILDITTGDTIKINPNKDFDDAGGFKWSEDGLRFLYSTATYTNDSTTFSVRYALHLVDAKTGIEKTILDSPRDCFQVVEWFDTDILKIHKNYNESIIEFDLNTNTILSETPINP